jgi:hypothetical protein
MSSIVPHGARNLGARLGDRSRFDSGSLRECVSQTPDVI